MTMSSGAQNDLKINLSKHLCTDTVNEKICYLVRLLLHWLAYVKDMFMFTYVSVN